MQGDIFRVAGPVARKKIGGRSPKGQWPRYMNDLAKGLEKQYPVIMATIEKLIDPEEMGIIKKQCRELKAKRGY